MNRLSKLTIILALVLLFTLSAAGQITRAAAVQSTVDAEFKTLIDLYYAAWSIKDGKLDFDTLAEFYAKDANLIFYDPAPPLNGYNGWDEFKAGVQKMYLDSNISSLKLSAYDDLRFTRRGNIAWTTVTFHMLAKPKTGEAMEMDGRQTIIWEQRGSKWLMVHEHASAPLPN